MDKELERYYEDRIVMMNSKAWKDFVEDVTAIAEKTADIHNITTAEQLHFKKGELSVLEWVMQIEKVSRMAYDKLLEDEE
jgi:hypothetical protein